MREQTILTGFHAVFKVSEVSPAIRSQRVERAVTKQAVETFRLFYFMTGEKFTGPV